MYLNHIRIENIKCFHDIVVNFKAVRGKNADRQHNWNVILGDNGDGKTTFLQAIATTLLDTTTAQRLQDFTGWKRKSSSYGRITLEITQEKSDLSPRRDHVDEPWQVENSFKIQYVLADADTQIDGLGKSHTIVNETKRGWSPAKFDVPTLFDSQARFVERKDDNHKNSELFDSDANKKIRQLHSTSFFNRKDNQGWVRCGYGPLRSNSLLTNSQFSPDLPAQRFLPLFIGQARLNQYTDWLKELERLALKGGGGSQEESSFQQAKQFLIQLLPNVDDIILESEVYFVVDRHKLLLPQLSDGYQQIFSLIANLLKLLKTMRSDNKVPLNEVAGVVLIDEIDTHLHPKWQRKIGYRLTEIFPNIQFIVTTHSPFVAMAAGEGALTVLERYGDVVTANQTIPDVEDWAVNRVLTDVFGVSDHSWQTEQDLQRYELLRYQRIRGDLDEKGVVQLNELEADLNQRLKNDPASPYQRYLHADLVYLQALKQAKQERANATD